MDQLKTKIRHVPDFPKAGILFYDITTLLQDPIGFRLAIDSLATPFTGQGIELVVGIESRGFILGAAVADRIGAGFALVRKPGKLPSKTTKATYDLEYGSDSLEIHDDAVRDGQRVLIVDDLLATGGTARATSQLVRQLGGDVYALAFLIELVELKGREKLEGERIHAVLQVLAARDATAGRGDPTRGRLRRGRRVGALAAGVRCARGPGPGHPRTIPSVDGAVCAWRRRRRAGAPRAPGLAAIGGHGAKAVP